MTGIEQSELYEVLKLAVEEAMRNKQLAKEAESAELNEFITNLDIRGKNDGQD